MNKAKIVGILLIVAGILVMGLSVFMKLSAEKKSNEYVKDYMAYIDSIEPASEQTTNEAASNNSAAEQTTLSVTTPEGVMGVMVIDKIDLTAPIVEGTDNKSIRFALGHFENTSLPGQVGNFAVAGHRSYTFGEYFSRLDELENGDTIKVIYGKKTYTYTVEQTVVVEPDQVEVLNNTSYEAITLVTCTPKWTATHRLIVRGRLTEVE